MKKIYHSKTNNKKSFASIVLAILLTLSFNANPLVVLSKGLRNANAYKSSQTQIYYSNSTNNIETNFSDANYPSSLSEYFSDSDKNFDIYNNYKAKYEEFLKEKVNAFFDWFDEVVGYHTKYTEFLTFYGCDNLYEFYNSPQGSVYCLNLDLESFTEFFEYFAINETPFGEDNTLPAIVSSSEKYDNLSSFYNMLANHAKGEILVNSDDLSVTTDEAFHNASAEYARFKNYIDSLVAQTIPISTFDNSVTDTYSAAIIAKDAPTTLDYNYKSGSYTSYTIPNVTYETVTGGYRTIYYFGDRDDIKNLGVYDADVHGYMDHSASEDSYFETRVSIQTESSRNELGDNIIYYRLIEENEDGYIDSTHPTYYKFSSLPYCQSGSYYNVYVLNNDPSLADLATYSALYYEQISQADIDTGYYLNIPYQGDDAELFLNVVYNKSLFSKPFSYEEFQSYFVQGGISKLYFKYNSTSVNNVYVDSTKFAEFESHLATEGINYKYTYTSLNTSTANMKDYELIPTTSSYSSYQVTGYESYLYFEKVKEYYTESTTDYSGSNYETTTKAIVEFETHNVPALDFELTLGARNVYVLSDEASVEINAVTYTGVTQETIDAIPNLYIEVQDSFYSTNNIDKDTYKLYYKHTTQLTKKVYIVVDDDTLEESNENVVFKTLNYTVISKTEYEQNYSNYLRIPNTDSNYNSNFVLFYKYQRSVITSQTYIVIESEFDGSVDPYVKIGNGNLSNYSLIDESTNETIYTEAKTTLGFDDEVIFKLYYKLSDVFIQNTLKKDSAIYVLDTSLTTEDKTNYTREYFTPITSEELSNNSDLYVLLDEYDPYYVTLTDTSVKLYYRYPTGATTKVIYGISDIDTTSSSFDVSAYELITDLDENYVAGKEQYYKKIGTVNETPVTSNTYYYYKTSSTVSLDANSYYVISFYVYTIGEDTQATFYIEDTSKILTDIDLKNISTNGTWQQYVTFIATDLSSSSKINLYLYLGDKQHGIIGSNTGATISGSVFFDKISITKIGFSDYNKKSIDDVPVYSTLYKIGETEQPNEYADSNNNRVFITNSDTRFSANTFDYRHYVENQIDVYSTYTWNDIFDFDNADLQTNLLGKETDVEAEKVNNQLAAMTENIDGYDMYSDTFTDLWRYYISRDVSGQGNDFKLSQYQRAYIDGKLDVTITNQIEETIEDDDDDDEEESTTAEESSTEEPTDIAYVASPFKSNNYVLKLKNTNKNIPLGITSNAFKVEKFTYYRISLWVYSPNKEGKATIGVNSVLKTIQNPTYGSLLSTSIDSMYANVANSSVTTAEFGWIPVSIYIEGNNYEDLDCYLVLQADKDSTVYFDNIRIERITSSQYDIANSDSDSTTCALSLAPSSSLISTGVTNGNFDLVTNSSIELHDALVPYTAESWTVQTGSSTKVVAGVVSTTNAAFFNEYSPDTIKVPTEGSDNYSNIFAINAPSTVRDLNDTVDLPYRNNYSIYASSLSLSSNTVYKISYKFYKTSNFNGNMIANIYASNVSNTNVISNFDIPYDQINNGWQTYTFYIATGTSSATVYLEIGVKNATGLCYFKNVSSTTVSKTLDSIITKETADLTITATEDMYNAIKNMRFLDLSGLNFTKHSVSADENFGIYSQNVFRESATVTVNHTLGNQGVVVASFYDTVTTNSYSVSINDTTYYIGEYYTATIDETNYYVHKFYRESTNSFEYKLYSDDKFTTPVTKIGEEDVSIITSPDIVVKVGTVEHATTVGYKLYKYKDLTEEITTINESPVSVPSPDKVVVGEGSKATENTSENIKNKSYVYNFGTTSQSEYVINNVIIPATELNNAHSSEVLVLANSYSSDYIELEQTTTRSLGTSAFYILRIYVKTSNFSSENFGLNIDINAVDINWENINTTNSEEKDEFGFVCYEALVRTNSVDSISSFGIKFSLGKTDNPGYGYAIIAGIELTSLSNETEFTHYESTIDDTKDNIQKAIYKDTDKDNGSSSSSDSEEKKADDKNNISWATFFYIFSSILLVLTIAVALVAVILKKHPIKLSQKYQNEHDRDIDSISTKKSKNSASTNANSKDKSKNSGGIE